MTTCKVFDTMVTNVVSLCLTINTVLVSFKWCSSKSLSLVTKYSFIFLELHKEKVRRRVLLVYDVSLKIKQVVCEFLFL